MDAGVFKIVYGRLGVGSVLDDFRSEFGIDLDTLKAILHQKIVRDTMHNHHKNRKQANLLLKRWNQGESILEIAKAINFSPVMTAWLILENQGVHRAQFRAMLRSPSRIQDKRLAKEITEAVKSDVVYSPEAIAGQAVRSKKVENAAREWLSKKKIDFIDEQEAKEKKHAKTPYFLLKRTFEHAGRKIQWVECKASFGDEYETQRDYKKQLKHYVDLYGPGLVVYWYGFVEGLELEGVSLVSAAFFNQKQAI